MKHILNQLQIVCIAVIRLLGMILRALWQVLQRIILFVYRNRNNILQYRYTMTIVMVLSLLWAGWRVYRYFNDPATATQIINTPDPSQRPESGSRYTVLTSKTQHEPSVKSNEALVMSIYNWLGTPHRDGGENTHGTDCSGFVRGVYQEAFSINLSRNSQAMFDNDVTAIPKDQLQEGDLVFFNPGGGNISHVGIYLRNGRFVHTSSSKGVAVDSLNNPYFLKSYYASGRVRQRTE